MKFLVDNGSVHFSIGDSKDNAERPCGFLLTLQLTAIIFNCVVAITILRSPFRSYVFNILLLFLCLSLILDAGLNLTMATLVRASWTDLHRQLGNDYLTLFCNLNAASMQWPLIMEIYFLALLGAHRSHVLRSHGRSLNDFGDKDHDFRVIRKLGAFCWLLVPAILLPLALKVIDCGYFQERYSCSPAYVTQRTIPAVFTSLIFLLGYCIPWTAVLHYWISLLLRVCRERRRLETLELVALQRAAAQSSPVRGLGTPLGFSVPYWSQMWGNGDSMVGDGFRYFLLAGLLTLCHIIFVVPHSLFILTTQFYTSYHQPSTLLYLSYDLPQAFRAISTSWLDNTFTWFRFFYTAIVPILILIVHQDLRRQCLILFNVCQHKNHVYASGSSLSGYLLTRKSQKRKRRSKLRTLDDVKTPVLFATTEGIFLRTAADPYAGFNNFRASFPSKAAVIEPRFLSVFTDVTVKETVKSRLRVLKSPKLSAKSVKNEVESLEEDDASRQKKGGKSVRFSQRVSEIPLTDSGVSSSGSAESFIVTVRAGRAASATAATLTSDQQTAHLQTADRRVMAPRNSTPSDPFVTPASNQSTSGGDGRAPVSTLEQLLSSTALTSSSSSLLLSLSQRMRSRNS